MSDISRIVASAVNAPAVTTTSAKVQQSTPAAAKQQEEKPAATEVEPEPKQKKEPFYKRFFGTFFD